MIREMVYRNRKSDVTDADGAFIFHGQRTSAVQVACSPLELAFDRSLQDYIRRGYEAAAAAGRPGRAIGFVMTIYRKLAASSSAAILRALERRLANLEDDAIAAAIEEEERDDRFEGDVWDVHISEAVATALKLRGRRARLTTSRRLARGDIAMLDFDSPLFRLLVERAKHHDFGGLHALVGGAGCRALVTARLRWQNDQGRKLREEFVALSVDGDGSVKRNGGEVSDWLISPAVDGADSGSREQRISAMDAALDACADHLAAGSNLYVHPMQAQTIAAAWSSPRDPMPGG